MRVVALSLPELIAAFVAVVATEIILVGYLFNLVV